MTGKLGRVVWAVQDCLSRGGGCLGGGAKDEEALQFAKFSHSESEKELRDLRNGAASGVRRHSSSSDGAWEQGRQSALPPAHNRISAWQAGWNVTNAIQGMFIVSFPYTVVQGGYWSLVAMVAVAYICCHTGKILVDCLYLDHADGTRSRVRSSYVEIADTVWGPRFGGLVINVAQLIELLMTCILYVLLCGDLIQGSFPDSPLDLSSWIMVTTVPLLACAFLTSLQRVSLLSFWCTVAHMLINLIIILFCLTRVQHWQWSAVQVRVDIWTLPISLGIVVFSYTSQIFLPTLEGNLRDRSQFSCMLHWTHAAAAVFKVVFSWSCFLTFGEDTLEVITNNLPTQPFRVIISFILVAKALLSYPLPYFAAVDVLTDALFKGKPTTVFRSCLDEQYRLKVWAVSLRLGLVLLTTVLAVVVPHFSLLMGLIGSFTGIMLSFVWPCYFHLRLKWRSIGILGRIQDIVILVAGLLCSAIGIYYSGHALDRAFHGLPPQPVPAPAVHSPGTGS